MDQLNCKDFFNILFTNKFLKHNYPYYKEIILEMNTSNRHDFEGALRYISYEDTFNLFEDYLKTYFKEELDDFKSINIKTYDFDLLEELSLLTPEELMLNTMFNNIDLNIEEINELIECNGYYDIDLGNIKFGLTHTILDAFSLCHEYTHKMFYDSHDISKSNKYFNIYTELLSYYNTYLFADYLLTKNISSDALIARYYDLINIIEFLNGLKDILNIYQEKDASLQFEEDDIFDLSDSFCDDHILASIASKTLYEENKNKNLEERIDKFKIMLNAPINRESLRECNLYIKDKDIRKRLILNFNK